MDGLDRDVERAMAGLDNIYTTLRRHPYVRGIRADQQAEEEFLSLLERAKPVTESEKCAAAFARWMASRNRGAYIKAMFEERFAFLCLYMDPRMIETGLGLEGRVALSHGPDGYRVGPPRGPASPRPAGSSAGSGKPRRTRERRGGRPARSQRDGKEEVSPPRGTSIPVLSEAERRSLLEELDRSSDDEPAPAAATETTEAESAATEPVAATAAEPAPVAAVEATVAKPATAKAAEPTAATVSSPPAGRTISYLAAATKPAVPQGATATPPTSSPVPAAAPEAAEAPAPHGAASPTTPAHWAKVDPTKSWADYSDED